MTKYKLLKAMPNAEAGKICEGTHNFVDIIDKRGEIYRYHKEYVENFDSWFEEIKEPMSSIHWKPKHNEEYWFMSGGGFANDDTWLECDTDMDRHRLGNVYRTEEGCQKAIDRQKAITTLQRSSDFVPDWNDREQIKYTAYYNCCEKKLAVAEYVSGISGVPVYFATYEDAEDSIKNHKKEWLLFFEIKEK